MCIMPIFYLTFIPQFEIELKKFFKKKLQMDR